MEKSARWLAVAERGRVPGATLGPGTGARYEALKQEFTDRIEGLLAESPSSNS